MISGHSDVYFGAKFLSSDSFMEEYGFVPNKLDVDGDSSRDCKDLKNESKGSGRERGILYEDFHQLYKQNLPSGEDSGPECIPTDRIPLEPLDDTNSNIIESENSQIPFLIDDQIKRELEFINESPKTKIRKFIEDKQKYQRNPLLCRDSSLNQCQILHGEELKRKRHVDDLYTPRLVRGKGVDREGICDLCNPPIWLKIKQSAYWYHMNFAHGISAKTGLAYPEPVRLRSCIVYALAGNEVEEIEGKCPYCKEYVLLQQRAAEAANTNTFSTKCLTWWKHAQKCSTKYYKIQKYNAEQALKSA